MFLHLKERGESEAWPCASALVRPDRIMMTYCYLKGLTPKIVH